MLKTIVQSIHTFFSTRTLTIMLAFLLPLTACDSSTAPNPDKNVGGELLLVTSIPNQSGLNGSSFIQTTDLYTGNITNAGAIEMTFQPAVSIHGDQIFVAQTLHGDLILRYERGPDGRLTQTGRMSLPSGSYATSIVFASDTKAYIALTYAGKIMIFNPQTMSKTGMIDMTTLGIARNPSNPEDHNPEPSIMQIRNGKLFVALTQLTTGFSSANGVDIAVIDVKTDKFIKVIHDPRASTPGRFTDNRTMFVDEKGNLYVYCHASFGVGNNQTAGILRIPAGKMKFDPNYFINLDKATINVPGGDVGFLNAFAYRGNGIAYAIALIPGLDEDGQRDFVSDRVYKPIRINLYTGEIKALPLPPSNTIGRGLAFYNGKVIFGLSTKTGVGLYTYNPKTGETSNGVVLKTQGDPSEVLVFEK